MACVPLGYCTALVCRQLFHDSLSIPLSRVKRKNSSWTAWPLSSLTVWRWNCKTVPKRQYLTTIHLCVISQEIEEFLYTVVEAGKLKQICCIFCEIRCARLGAFAKLRKSTISFAMSICPSIRLCFRMEQLGSHWADIHEVWYLKFFQKSVENTKIPLKSDRN
jgi:hypothetical protein